LTTETRDEVFRSTSQYNGTTTVLTAVQRMPGTSSYSGLRVSCAVDDQGDEP